VNCELSSATGTIINVEEKDMLFTTAHLFPVVDTVPLTQTILANQFDSILTQKWSYGKDGEILSRVPPLLLYQDVDIAVGILERSSNVLVAVTIIPSPKFENWWGDILPNFFNLLEGMTLVKMGLLPVLPLEDVAEAVTMGEFFVSRAINNVHFWPQAIRVRLYKI
jgi:hypothetical protein